MKLVTVSQMQAIEKEADAGGLTYDQMMQNAGQGLADIILDLFVDEIEPEVVGLVGPGNNGGDTLVAMTALLGEGWKARALLVKRKRTLSSSSSPRRAVRSFQAKAPSRNSLSPSMLPTCFWTAFSAPA
jgi:NAD(P)H-hydrate repair Nnr-like enzyme with NAD(P)H-hydrate epimerase domain